MGFPIHSSYWHPGHIHYLAVGSLIDSYPRKIIVGGINNDLSPYSKGIGYLYTVFMLDPNNIYGEAPPYFGNLGKGTHVWYGKILPKGLGINRFELLDQNADGFNEICVWTSKGHVFYLNFNGEVVGTGKSDGTEGFAKFELYEK
jgi:hypothetical protein